MRKRFLGLGVALAMLGMAIGFSGCSKNLTYENADKYTAGGATLTAEVTSIEVEWLSGNVNVVHAEGEGVTFVEKSGATLNERTTLYYWLENTTLHIKFAQSRIGWWNGNYPEKDLTVTLPLNSALRELEIDSVSAEVNVESVSAKHIEIESVSGDIKGSLDKTTKGINIETVSGNVNLTSVSVEEFDVETTSGDVTLQTVTSPHSGSFESTSGDFVLTLPASIEGFSVEVETTSGDFDSEFETVRNGKVYTYGNAVCQLETETVSGNITIRKG